MNYLFFLSLLGCSTEKTYEPQFHFGDQVTFSDKFYKNCEGTINDFNRYNNDYRVERVYCNHVASDPIWVKSELLTKKEYK